MAKTESTTCPLQDLALSASVVMRKMKNNYWKKSFVDGLSEPNADDFIDIGIDYDPDPR